MSAVTPCNVGPCYSEASAHYRHVSKLRTAPSEQRLDAFINRTQWLWPSVMFSHNTVQSDVPLLAVAYENIKPGVNVGYWWVAAPSRLPTNLFDSLKVDVMFPLPAAKLIKNCGHLHSNLCLCVWSFTDMAIRYPMAVGLNKGHPVTKNVTAPKHSRRRGVSICCWWLKYLSACVRAPSLFKNEPQSWTGWLVL